MENERADVGREGRTRLLTIHAYVFFHLCQESTSYVFFLPDGVFLDYVTLSPLLILIVPRFVQIFSIIDSIIPVF